MKKILSLLLVLVMLIGAMPMSLFAANEESGVSVQNPFAGKTISILGASISTYTGISNNSDYNSTIGNNAIYYTEGLYGIYANDTWWMQVCDDLGLRLLVNNSWSGSALLHTRNGTVGAYVDRCVQLHDNTGDNAGEEPDIIGIQMGSNDFQYYKDTLGTADIDYDVLITENEDGSFTYVTPVTSLEAAAIVLHKISVRYPNAEVYYLNVSQRIDGTDARSFNTELKKVVEHFGAHIVDIYGSVITPETFDTHIGDGRVHPNKLGMDAYTEAFKRALLDNTAYEVDTHTVSLDLDGVTANYGDDKIVVSGDAFSCELTAEDGKELSVSVSMGGEDITDTTYENGTISIESVIDDVVITAEATVHKPQNYRWEFDGTDLACVSGGNTLTKDSGTTMDGVFSKTSYTLENEVVLLHDLPWVVEWKCEGTFQNSGSSSGARVFTSDNVNANYNARYIFKSNTNGIVAMGEKTTSGSHNYGIALGDHGIDWTLLHTYRLENRIADDGGNMVYLLVDGEEIGPLNHYYIGTKDQNSTSDWLSVKDFVFPYMGTDTHGFTNASIDYIQVTECYHTYKNGICTGCGENEPSKSMSLRYDDHLDMSGKTVEIIDAGTPTSYQVGYGVEENAVSDTAVVTLEGNYLVATGVGTATVKVDGETYEITVTAAPISLLLLIGQSNMRGSEGNANQSIVCLDGMVYSTYGDDRGESNTAMTVSNASHFAPSALTGTYSSINVAGTTDCLSGYPVNSLTEAGSGKIGPDSGFAYEWVKQTGEKVWVVNAAHGGTSINVWQPGTTEYEQCQALFTACQETLRKEIAAGHFTLSHMAYFWCQGCSDRVQSAQWYVNKYLAMHNGLKTEMSFDHDSNADTADKTFEFGGIIPVRVGSTATCYRDGVYSISNPYAYHESFADLRFSGPRVAQYWMINNSELSDIWGVCDIGDNWVWMPDGTNGVADYFNAHYENGIVDYKTQVQQKASWYKATTPAAVHDSIHYNQIGYNEIGRESVRNALILLGEIEPPQVETTVELLTWNGYTLADQVSASTIGSSETLVVPKVYPIWKSKDVTYELSEGLSWNYYDLLVADPQTAGTLTVAGGYGNAVTVIKAAPNTHFSSHLSQLPDKFCCSQNLWSVLEHDEYYYASGTHWSIYNGRDVPSVTILVNPGDHIFATSFGRVGENGHTTSSGIRTTFFSAYGIAKTMTPAETYAEFTANGGYLIAPDGAVAINIPMWNNSEENEIYILNRDHCYKNGLCTVCGAEHPNLANYEGKVISIMGDSISTFAGYIPVADGFNLQHYARYPQDNLFTEVEHTWWMQVLTALNAKLGINESWRSTEVYNYIDAEVNSSYDGTKACMASITRIQNLGSNGTPDVILFYGGTNDITQRRPVGSFDPATAPTEVDLISVKWDTVADAYVDAIMRMQHYYPNAEIVAMLPTFTYKNTDAVIEAYNSVFAAICEHYGVTYVDLRECGISTSDLPDGTHPNATGMDYITAAVMGVLMSNCDVEAGEHIVHSVTHNLTGAESSLSYYKGISHGNSFVTTITGENLKVTVTMGGTDITADCYTDGVVSIEKVTGDIVITAKGIQKTIFDDYLQGLPENLCSGTNLWTELKPINLYYTTSGWGLNASGSAYSITIPISEGDKIWATSFQKSGTNGGAGNGIRLTWFDADGVLRSLSPTETYAEFIANGYLTAPEGAVAVNVVMWNGNESNEVYILNRDHCYKDEFDAFCDGCNAIREINYPADKVELREIDGVKYIYVNGRTSVEGLFKIGDDYYYATWGGVVLYGDQYVHFSYCDKAAGRHFYFSEDGKMLDKGIVTGEDGIKRLYVDSRTSVEGLFEVEGKYYLATWGGVVLTDGRYYISESFVDGIDGGSNFTVGSDGEILDGVVEIDGQKYYYDFGTTVFPGIYEIDGIEYTVTWGGLIEE